MTGAVTTPTNPAPAKRTLYVSIGLEPAEGALHVIDNWVESIVLTCGAATCPGTTLCTIVTDTVVGDAAFFSVTTDDPLRPERNPVAVNVYGPAPPHAHVIVVDPAASATASDSEAMEGEDVNRINSPGTNPDTEPITRNPPSHRYGFSVHTNATGAIFRSLTIDDPDRPDRVPNTVNVYGPFPAHAQMISDAPDESAATSDRVAIEGDDVK
jgi:hypothetical protein